MKIRMAALAALGVFGVTNMAHAASVVVDGSLDAAYGSTPLTVQKNVSDSHAGGAGPADDGGPTARPADEGGIFNPTGTGTYSQLSNAYAFIDSSDHLNLFIGGSLNNYDSAVNIAIQAAPTGGVTNLSGQSTTGQDIDNVAFTGYKPTALIQVSPTYNGPGGALDSEIGNIQYTNLAAKSAQTSATFVTAALNNALDKTLIGTGLPGSPTFASATTGLELSINLASIGYTGGAIELSAFMTEDSGTAVNNQVLTPFSYFNDGAGNQTADSSGRVDPNGGDYSFIDNTNHTASPSGRQFVPAVYPGVSFFTVAAPTAAVPEPTSLGLLAVGGMALLRRRRSNA